jgi:hypothetical protein
LPVQPAAEFIAALSQFAAAAPQDRFMLEVNPIKWTRETAVAVDGLILLGSNTQAPMTEAELAPT